MARSAVSETADSTGPICADCGTGPVVIYLDAVPLCDRCHDARISEATGWPRLPEPPAPETISGPDGRGHLIVYRVWRSPVGIVVEASEGDRSAGKALSDETIDLAVRAHIRHSHTPYDDLLMDGWERDRAREALRRMIDEVVESWSVST